MRNFNLELFELKEVAEHMGVDEYVISVAYEQLKITPYRNRYKPSYYFDRVQIEQIRKLINSHKTIQSVRTIYVTTSFIIFESKINFKKEIMIINTVDDVLEFAKYLNDRKISFHPDDSFENSVSFNDIDYETNLNQAKILDLLMQKCFMVCEENNVEIYEVMNLNE